MPDDHEERYDGVAEDDRPDSEKERDWTADEAYGAVQPVWRAKKAPAKGAANYALGPKVWRRFPAREQRGGSCFIGGTPVLTESMERVPIEQVRVGDRVISHTGAARAVTATSSRPKRTGLVEVKAYGSLPFTCTPEHPVLTRDRGWVAASDLVPRLDYLVCPKALVATKDVATERWQSDPDFLWALGLYLAEGSIDKKKGSKVTFTLHEDEVDEYRRICRFGEKYQSNVSLVRKTGTRAVNVHLYGKRWGRRFLESGGKLCDGKKLTATFMLMDPSLQRHIFDGWMAGDGHVGVRHITGVTTSPHLIRQMSDIARRCGIRAAICERKNQPSGKRRAWNLSISVPQTTKDGKKRGKIYYTSDAANEYVLVERASKTCRPQTGKNVYNLDVEIDHSYVVESCAVHNCVAHSHAKNLGIENFTEEARFLEESARPIFARRRNRPASGMSSVDAFAIVKEQGTVAEAQLASMRLRDEEMDAPFSWDDAMRAHAARYKATKYVTLAASAEAFSIDAVAAAIETHRCGVVLHIFAKGDEWKRSVPSVVWQNLTYQDATIRHAITAVDYTLYKGRKALVIEDSYAVESTDDGQRILTEDFLSRRCRYAAHFLPRPNVDPDAPPAPKPELARDLGWGDRGQDVAALQSYLKSAGFFPAEAEPTGLWRQITAQSVRRWQVARGIADFAAAPDRDVRFGPKSRAALAAE